MLTATADLLDSHPGRIVVQCDYRSKDAVKSVPGARWDNNARVWHTPLSWPACLALRVEFTDGLTIGPELRAWAKAVGPTKKQLVEMRSQFETSLPLPDLPGMSDLFPHQRVDAISMDIAESFLLMNGTGTGKTRSALAGLSLMHARGLDIFPVLVTAPKSMIRTWANDEIKNYFPDATVAIADGSPTAIRKALTSESDFYVIGWEALRRYSKLARFGSVEMTAEEKEDHELQAVGFRTAIFDEAHRCKNPKAKRTRAAWAVADDCDYRFALTGTPLQESVEDLYGVLRLVLPDEYPTKTAYMERYVDTEWNLFGGRDVTGIKPERKEEFDSNFLARTRRVTKDMSGLKLPPKINEIRWVALPPKMRKAYNAMRDKYVAELSDGSILASENQLVKAGRLIQMASAEMIEEPDTDPTKPPKYIISGKSPKVDAFIDDLIEGDFDGEQIVVFSESIGVLNICQEALIAKKIEFVRIDGAVTGDARKAAMDGFQSGEFRVCLLSRAGGEGITLTAASVMVRLMRSWSYIVHTQVEDRVHRIGSEKHDHITYVDYIAEDTIEIEQLVRLNDKDAASKDALGDRELLSMLKKAS